MSAVVSNQLPRMTRASALPLCDVNVAVALLPITITDISIATEYDAWVQLTLEAAFHLHDLLPCRTFNYIRSMNM